MNVREHRASTDDAPSAARWRTLALLAVAELLGMSLWFSGSAVVPALTKSLGDDSPVVREWAARVLGLFGAAAEPALPELARLGDDKEEVVRITAKQAVARIEGAKAMKAEQLKPNPEASGTR